MSNASPNPAHWRSSCHTVIVNLDKILLIHNPDWYCESGVPTKMELEYMDQAGQCDVLLYFSPQDALKIRIAPSDYCSLLSAYEIFLSGR